MFAGGGGLVTSTTGSGTASTGGSSLTSGAGGANSNHAGGGSSANSNSVTHYSNAIAEANDLDALVFEFGTAKCKFGYAGEDFPRVYESPVLADFPDAGQLDDIGIQREAVLRAAQMETDYERVAQWLFDAASTRLQTKLSEHPLLVAERPFPIPEEFRVASTAHSEKAATADDRHRHHLDAATSDKTSNVKKRDLKARERMVEVLMEQVDLPALFCAKSSVLTCYANARTSGLVVELGATYASLTSVHEGYAFQYPKSQVVAFGGHDLDAFLRYKLDAQLTAPRQQPIGSRFYWSLAVEAKESGLCRVADGPFDEAQNMQLPKISYELPDKTVIQLGTERFSVAEQYFTPSDTQANDMGNGSDAVKPWDNEELAQKLGLKRGISLPDLICETGAMTTETELRKEMFQNIVLSGGSSCFENLPSRLEREIVVSLSSFQGGGSAITGHPSGFSGSYGGLGNLRVKLISAHAQERRIGSFLGGSILASLGSFHEMWMSKAEYAEHGAALIHKKCP
ncbi:hypothetical protein P43SY_009246 [Pythium insidiosum]|uniref:Actin-like protein n=1 Tax=Pythium insidiosum TaxID=114742 RepID=A0AAD5LWI9_PYTIN|nr:hypothetical protein P43SY_009246 [Pythium insidiosum]